jgi:hypothetical protein
VADAALPDPQALHAAVGALCPGVPDDELRDFL